MQCNFKPLSEERRIANMEVVIDWEHHNLAIDKLEILDSLVDNNIKAGFQIPILLSVVHKIKNRVLAPYRSIY